MMSGAALRAGQKKMMTQILRYAQDDRVVNDRSEASR
jgi:hypothetical protein